MKHKILLLFQIFILFIGVQYSISAESKLAISGYVKDASSGEVLIGALVSVKSINYGTSTNVYGYYSLSLPKGDYEVTYSYLGYTTINKKIELKENVRLDISLDISNTLVSEVKVTGTKNNENIENTEMSVAKLPIKTIRKIPMLMGEVDVIKSIQLLPGVSSGVEGSTGFYVRGGGVDQNLVLLDDAPVYNASHVAGFFSVFNGDAVKNITLYKGGIPAEYGGRLSSILDIRMNDGNMKNHKVTGGVGILSSRLTVEGPIIKDKCSFIISGRRTYFDLFLPLAKDSLAKESKVYFYDLNAKLNYNINNNNKLFLSGYFGRDVFGLGNTMSMDYGNKTGTIRWNHIFNEKLFFNLTYVYSNYLYKLKSEDDLSVFNWNSNIIDNYLKTDITLYPNVNNTIKIGGGVGYHKFDPGKINGSMDTVSFEFKIPNNYALDYFAFIQNDQKVSKRISLNYGLRYSIFQNIGKSEYYLYDTKDPENYVVTDTITQKKGEIFNTYSGFEPRISLKYSINENNSIKTSYNRTIQYLHLASNSTSATPLDLWIPSTPNVKPQKADQVALGYFKNIYQNIFETSIEVYYKKMYDIIDFRDHAQLLVNDKLEGELRRGDAESYGLELYLRKQDGDFTGWISYTLSKTTRFVPEVNNGKEYYAPYDRTHNISVVLSYDLNQKYSFSANWVYSTAPPRTMPTGRFEYEGMIAPVYSDRNTVRIFDYHRLDLSANIELGKTVELGEKKKKYESSLNISIYNVYGRKNPFTITFKQSEDDPNKTVAEMVYLFSVIPSITYNFKF